MVHVNCVLVKHKQGKVKVRVKVKVMCGETEQNMGSRKARPAGSVGERAVGMLYGRLSRRRLRQRCVRGGARSVALPQQSPG